MRTNRRLLLVTGDASRVASRAALRLAYLGDDIEPVSATEFVWRPQPAERRLFRCPRAVRIAVVPAEESGRSTVVIEWRGDYGLPWLKWVGAAMALLGVAVMVTAGPEVPLWRVFGGLVPAVMALLGAPLLDSGWAGRIEHACSTGTALVLEQVPDSDRWLTLDEDARAVSLAAVRQHAIDAGPTQVRGVGSTDRQSAIELLGWPLWHVAAGRDPVTDQLREARGWYARGQKARGLVAVGQMARGWFALGQMALGIVAIGQAAVGLLLAVGQLAIAGLFSISQLGAALVAAGMAVYGTFIAMMEVAPDAVTQFLLVVLGGLTLGLALVVPTVTRFLLRSTEQKRIAERVDLQRVHTSTVADEFSLSPAERLTDEADAERGISVVRTDED